VLMYGGGHLLLKDTVLDIQKNRRYGILGHNGCGKTTLMKELQAGRVSGMPKELKCVHVSDADLGNMKVLEMNSMDFVARDMPKDSEISVHDALVKVGFPKDMQEKPVSDLSGGWRMRLLLACAMMKRADILLLDEPTNHLDVHAIEWLCQYLLSVKTGALMVISHDPHFLNAVCTDIIQYREKKLIYYKGNFDAFKEANKISDDDADVLLSGNMTKDHEREALGTAKRAEGAEGAEEGEGGDGEEEAAPEVDLIVDEPKAAAVKLVFPIPGKLDGVRNNTKPVMQIKEVYFGYPGGKGLVINGASCALNLGSRVALIGRNGAGKSTLLGLMCGELNPSEHEGKTGDVWQHHNLRLSFIAQHHMTSLGNWYESTPFTYLSYRFQNGWDEEMQEHLIKPKDEEEKRERIEKAAKFGKYGKLVAAVIGRSVNKGKMMYEVKWQGMDDQKQHTFETIHRLRELGVEGAASACNLRLAVQNVELRPCSRREIVKHLEQFGFDEEMCCNRLIGGFSAGQKSKLALACATWTKPHLLALDEPTNYLDQETVESLARALRNFRGGVVVVTHSRDFIEKVCNEEWLVKDGSVTISKVDQPSKGK
jgi:ATPase subunit of ABC transporter with duplicated ATPase domains